MQLFKLLAKIIPVLSMLNGCATFGHKAVNVPDFEYCLYEGPAGGPNAACACAHSLFTDQGVKTYGLQVCLQKLQGAVFFQGAQLNRLQSTIDEFCTEDGNCTYEQEQAQSAASSFMRDARSRRETLHRAIQKRAALDRADRFR